MASGKLHFTLKKKRQITSWYYYEKSFDLVDPMKGTQRPTGAGRSYLGTLGLDFLFSTLVNLVSHILKNNKSFTIFLLVLRNKVYTQYNPHVPVFK